MALSKEQVTDIIDGLSKASGPQKEKLRKILGESAKSASETDETYQNRMKDLAKISLLEAEVAANLGKQSEYRRQMAGAYEAFMALQEEGFIKLKEGLSDEEKKLELIRQGAEHLNLTVDQMEQVVEKGKEATDQLEKFGKVLSEGEKIGQDFFGGIASKLGMASDVSRTFIGQLKNMQTKLKDPKAMDDFIGKFKEIFSLSNMIGSLFMKIAQSTLSFALAVDKATAKFAAQTGAGRLLTREISNVSDAHRNLGITAEQAGKAAQGLFEGMNTFQQQSQGTRQNLMKVVGGLELLGVSTDDSTQAIVFFNKNLGVSADKAAAMTRELAMTGKSLGMTASKITKEFNSAMKTLAVYGTKAPKVFKGLAAMAAASNVEIGKLLDLAGKFDTFASAAETTGKLNAILGTQMSATQMLTMNEQERVETLISSIQAQGRAFKEMNKFEQQAIAAAAGIDDLNQAQKIFGMNLGQYRKFGAAAKAAAKEEEEFNKRMKEAMDIAKKFQMILAEFAINLGPVIDDIANMVQGFLDFISAGDGLMIKLALVSGAVALFFKVLWPLKFLIIPLVTKWIPSLGAAFVSTTTQINISSQSLRLAASGMANFGRATLGAAGPIALIAGSLAALVAAMGYMFSNLDKLAEAVSTVSTTGVAFVTALTALGTAGFFADWVLEGVADAMVLINKAMNQMDPSKLEHVSTLFEGLGKMSDVQASGTVDSVVTLVDSLNEKPDIMKPMLENMALLVTGQSSDKMASGTAANTSKSIDKLAEALKNIGGGQKQITIQLDKGETKEFLRDWHVKVHREA